MTASTGRATSPAAASSALCQPGAPSKSIRAPPALEWNGSNLVWVWLKIKELGLRGFWSLVPYTKVPFWYHFFEPQPYLSGLPSHTQFKSLVFEGFFRSHGGPGIKPLTNHANPRAVFSHVQRRRLFLGGSQPSGSSV